MAIKLKHVFAKTSVALALAGSAGLAQAAVNIEDVTVEQTLAQTNNQYVFTGNFTATGDINEDYTFGVVLDEGCVSNKTEDNVATLSITGDAYTLTLLDENTVALALTTFNPGQRFPLPAFEYCVTNNTDQTTDTAAMTWNLRVPGTTEDVLVFNVARSSASGLVVDLYNDHSDITAMDTKLIVDMGAIASCEGITATVNGASTTISCPTTTNDGLPADWPQAAVISSTNELAPGDSLRFAINYPAGAANVTLHAVADYTGGSLSNSFPTTEVSSAPVLTFTLDNAEEETIDGTKYDGFDGEDLKITFTAPVTSVTVTPGEEETFVCSEGIKLNANTLPSSQVDCNEDRLSLTLSNVAAGSSLIVPTADDCANTNSDCSATYEVFASDSSSHDFVMDRSTYLAYEEEEDSLAALIAFMSLLASFWYFRREKSLKAN